jgi:aldehyde:ferredoxin oxidoreductase
MAFAAPFGYTGRILHVDLSTGALSIETPDAEFYRTWLGGSALGLAYILRNVPAGADPFGPENMLTFAVGPLAGAPISGQSRVAINGKSPVGGTIGDSQMGGVFPAELKFAGFDAITVRGVAPAPVYLWVHDGEAELRDAAHLWGRVTGEVDDLLREELRDERVEIAQCGPAGERLIRYSAIITMSNRAAGRTGLGAVMGAKRLKAIAVRGSSPTRIADAAPLKELQRAGTAGLRTNARMFGLQRYGTGQTVMFQQAGGTLPSSNWDSGSSPAAEAIDGTTLSDTLLLRNDTCYACAVRCKRVVEHRERGVNPRYGGPEYETLATFGALCGVSDLPAIALANQVCNQHGLDTIAAGSAIAFAIDCFQQGRIDTNMTGGRELRFGDTEGMLWVLDQIVQRRGIGDVLAEGTDVAATAWDAHDLNVTVKGSNLPAHMPQAKRSLALIYAVNPFGADHQSHEHDPAATPDNSAEDRRRLALLGVDEQLDSSDLSDAKVRFAWETQKFYSLLDSASVCQFVYGPGNQLYGPDHLRDALNAATGWDLTIEELQTIGERRINLMRAFNAREGIGREEDTLPKKLFKPLKGGPTAGFALTHAEVERAKERYYELAGWDSVTGTPTLATLERLGIDVDTNP